MKKVYNYRNTTNINCKVYNTPVGFKLSDYEEINEKLYELKENPIDIDKSWKTNDVQDKGNYHLNIDFKKKKLLFSINGSTASSIPMFSSYQWYYHIVDSEVFSSRNTDYEDLFNYWKELNWKGEKLLVPVDIKRLDFNVPVKDITSMEVISKWWRRYIYIQLNFNRVLKHGTDYVKLRFHKDDKQDADFIIKEINTMRRMIQSEEHERILNRFEDIDDEQEIGQDY